MAFQRLYQQLLGNSFSELIGTFQTRIVVLVRSGDQRHLEIYVRIHTSPARPGGRSESLGGGDSLQGGLIAVILPSSIRGAHKRKVLWPNRVQRQELKTRPGR